jgi:hypothetical protein
MRSILLTTALIVISPAVSGCGGSGLAPAIAPSHLTSTNDSAFASDTERPFAYVAQTCASGSSCPWPNGMVQMLGGRAITEDIENPTALALDGSGNLYVGNSTASNQGDVSIYAPKSVKAQRILSGLLGVPRGLAANAAGRLFVVAQYRLGCCEVEGTGAIYPPGATKLQRHLKGLGSFPNSPVLDKFGNLYVANFDVFPGWVSVYGRGRHVPSRVIQNGIGLPVQLAIAPNADLVVANGLFSGHSNVLVYPAGESVPSLTIVAGLRRANAVAVDADGNIYVANGDYRNARGVVTVYHKGQNSVWRTIRSGITFPAALAFDGSGRLYVANAPRKGANTIAVFASGGSTPMRTYTLKERFSAIAVPR